MASKNHAPLERQNSLPPKPKTPNKEQNRLTRDVIEMDSDEEYVFLDFNDVIETDSDEEYVFSAIGDVNEMDSDEEYVFPDADDIIETDSDEEYVFSAVAGEKPDAKAENANSKQSGAAGDI